VILNPSKKEENSELSLKQIMKNIPDEKILQLMKGRSFDTEDRQVLYQAKTWPEKYFKKDELLKYYKKDKKSTRSKKGRKGPEESATLFPIGTIKQGNDGNMWVINVSKNGVQRWVKSQTGERPKRDHHHQNSVRFV